MNAPRAGSVAMSAVALVVLLPALCAAQQGPAALDVPHPLPPIAATLPVPPRDLYLVPVMPAPPSTIHIPGRGHGPSRWNGAYGSYAPGSFRYDGSSYLYGVPEGPAPMAVIARGGLRFDASPSAAQVHVDGMYVGTVEDFGLSGHALDLDEGAHRVELRATGYATLSFDIHIAANHTTRYRGDLQPLAPATPAAAPVPLPASAHVTYLIPNCYAGDRPPSHALRPGCDISKMLVRTR